MGQSIASGLFAGWIFVLADALGRDTDRWKGASRLHYAVGSLGLYALAGVVAGLVAWVSIRVARLASDRLRHHRSSSVVRVGFFGALAAACTARPAWLDLAGPSTRLTSRPLLFPYAATIAAACVAMLFAALVGAIAEAADRGTLRIPRLAVFCFAAAAGALQWIDLSFVVALYPNLHALLEASAAILWMSASGLTLRMAGRHRGSNVAVSVVAVMGVAWLLVVLVWPAARDWQTRTVGHVWRDPRYVGRMLARVQLVEDIATHSRGFRGERYYAMLRLLKHSSIDSVERDREWNVGPRASGPGGGAADQTRSACSGCNVIVYYVDTLRYDAASDPSVMPTLAEFSKKAVVFREAFSTASDTRDALPGLLSGRYDLDVPNRWPLLDLTHRAGMRQTLVIPQSAYEYLARERPEFAFDETIRIQDFHPERSDVWGYGADQPTASAIVDSAVDWLTEHEQDRFFLWLFHFDVHNWRELDGDLLSAAAAKHHVPEEGTLNWQYRVAVAGLDAELGRLLSALEAAHLADRTIVVVVSDHGEALGQAGFWVHSTFIWQSLVRVPFMIRIPGVEGKEISERVSTVDLTPTLARYIDPNADMSIYHGEDLVSWIAGGPRRRRLPILFLGAQRHDLLHLGLVEPSGPWKLDLPLDSCVPELYDLREEEPDDVDFAENQRPTMLSLLAELVHSPNFPRGSIAPSSGTAAIVAP